MLKLFQTNTRRNGKQKKNSNNEEKQDKLTLLYQVGNNEGARVESFLTKKKLKFGTVLATDVDKPTLLIKGKAFGLKGEAAIKAHFRKRGDL